MSFTLESLQRPPQTHQHLVRCNFSQKEVEKKEKCSSPIRVKRFVVESETRTEKGNLKNSQKEESVVIVARVADGREASTFRISTAFAAPRAWIPPEQDNQQLISISRCAAMKQGRTLFVFYRLRHFEL